MLKMKLKALVFFLEPKLYQLLMMLNFFFSLQVRVFLLKLCLRNLIK